jgi:hypothetical protein
MDYTNEFSKIYESAKTLREGKVYSNFKDLMIARNIPMKDYVYKNYKGEEKVHKVYDYPKDFFDKNVKIIKCIEKVDFDPDEEGETECITAAECEYHGKRIIIVLPVASEAEFIVTSSTPATYWDPGDTDGYYEVSDDIYIGDSFAAAFSSAEKYNEVYREYRANFDTLRRQKVSLGQYLQEHSDADILYTNDGDDGYEGGLLEEIIDDDISERYLDVVKGNFETEIGDKSTIDSYHKRMQDEEAEADRHYYDDSY